MRGLPLTIEYIPLEKLKLPERRVKAHPRWHVEQIVNSIKQFTFLDPIKVAPDGDGYKVIEGCGRVLAAHDLGWTEIPAIIVSHLNEHEQRAYFLASNQLTLGTDFYVAFLDHEFDELSEFDFGKLGFTLYGVEWRSPKRDVLDLMKKL